MPYETWAGGTISGAPGGGGGAGGVGHGGYIPIADVPNAPKTVSMDLPQYQAIPSIRHEYLKQDIDMESRGAKLMQKPLPESFEEAGNIQAAAAGRGQMAMGKAIQEGGSEISKAITGLGDVMAKMNNKALQSKDEVDELRFKKSLDIYQQRMNAAYERPINEWGKLKKEADDALREETAGLGQTPLTKDKFNATLSGILGGKDAQGRDTLGSSDWQIQAKMREKSMQQDALFGQQTLQDAITQKNYPRGYEAIKKLHGLGYYSDEMAQEAGEKLTYLQNLDTVNTAILTPQGAQRVHDQAEVVRRGGKSSDYELLNTNPNLAPNWEYEANQKIKQFREEGTAEIKERIAAGDLATPDDIKQAGKAWGLENTTINALINANKTPIAFDPAAHVEARKLVNDYDYHADGDGKQYEKAWTFIQTHVDKDNQAFFEEKLKAKVADGMNPKGGSAQKNELTQIQSEITTKFDAAMLVKPEEREAFMRARMKLENLKKADEKGEITEALKKSNALTGEESAAWFKANNEVRDLQNKADKAFEDYPDAKPGELRQKVFEDDPTFKNVEKNAGKAATSSAPRAGFVSPTQATREQLAIVKGMPILGPVKESGVFEGGFAGKENLFIAAANKYGVDPGLLMAISMHETDKGKAENAIAANNPGGMMNPATGGQTLIRYRTMEEGVDAMAKNLRENYIDQGLTTVEQIQGKYAPLNAENDPRGLNKDWVKGVNTYREQLKLGGQGTAGMPAGSAAVATVTSVSNRGAAPMTRGQIAVPGGSSYQYNSGGGGRGNLPPGDYIVTEHMPHRNTPGMTVGTVGFSFALSDKYDARVGGTRTLLRIHPDGGTAGTAGCIGIVGGPDQQLRFRDDMTAAIRQAGGKLHLRVG